MEMTTNFSPQELIKKATELATIGLAASYILGFLIVNTYLLQYGYSGGSLFKVKYISAGLLFLMIAFLLGLSIYPVYWATQQVKDPVAPERNRRAMLIGSAGFVLFLYQVLVLVGGTELQSSDLDRYIWIIVPLFILLIVLAVIQESKADWSFAIWLRKYPGMLFLSIVATILLTLFKWKILFLTFLPLIFVLWVLMDFALGKQSVIQRFRVWPLSLTFEILSTLFILIFSISSFATLFYGYAKPQYGGGLPAHVKMIISESKRNQLAKLGETDHVEKLLNDALLVDSSDLDYLIMVKTEDADGEAGGRLLQLDRAMVDAVLYLK